MQGQLLKWGVHTTIRAIYGAAAGFAANATLDQFHSTAPALVAATVVATLVAEPLDAAFGAVTLRLRGGNPWMFLRMMAPMLLVLASLYAPVVAALTIAYTLVSPWTVALFFVPALAAQRLFALYQEQRQLASQLAETNAVLEAANLSFASALVATLDARDRYTAGHSAAVAIYARDIAHHMGLSSEEVQAAHLSGLVHDIGKIGLPAGLLEKPGALTLDERNDMRRHSVIGERILANVEGYREIALIVRHHHEQLDGGGYPDGLSGDSIPLLSRIIAVADAYNAMTSDRPYRDAMPSRIARRRLAQSAGTQFDGQVVSAFESILSTSDYSYQTASSEAFSSPWVQDDDGQDVEGLLAISASA